MRPAVALQPARHLREAMKSRGANQSALSACIPGLQLLLKKMASAPFGVIVQMEMIAAPHG